MPSTTSRPWLLPTVAVVAAVALVLGAVLLGLALRSSPEATPGVAPTPSAASIPYDGPSPTEPSASDTPSASPSVSPATSPTARRSPPVTAPSTREPEGPAPSGAASTKPPVPLEKPEEVKRGLTARVSRLEAVAGEANGPGEVAGPAVRATITLLNQSKRRVDLTSTVVNLSYGADRTPGSALSGPGTKALPAGIAPGGSASGVFVFAVPEDGRSEVEITVDYSIETPVLAFRGPAPR